MPTILVIDDDAPIREMLKKTLAREGHTVAEAENGREAIKAIENATPGLVLTDIVMPEQDGIETIPLLRRRFPGIKIIAMSGGGPMRAEELLYISKKLGADGCLAKPFSNDVLLAEIQRVLSGKE